MPQTRVLQLNRNEHLAARLFRLEKGWKLKFTRGPSLMGNQVRLFVNDDQSNRRRYRELQWENQGTNQHDESGAFAMFDCQYAGPYHYFFVVNVDARKKIHFWTDVSKSDGDGYFQIAPTLKIHKSDNLPLDCIQSQTYLTKLLGPLSEWKDRLAVARYCGYNMVHFTPVQLLGCSNSSYSIADHLKLNDTLSDPNGEIPTYDDLGQLTQFLRDEWGILSVGDVVWNHTAKNSAWLEDHPECGYNLVNSPHLRPAFVLDRALQDFAQRVMNDEFKESSHLSATIENEDHLSTLHFLLGTILFPELKLHEYFMVDVEKYCKEFEDSLKNAALSPGEKADVNLEYSKYSRFGASVDIVSAQRYFCTGDNNYRLNAFRHHLDWLNEQVCKKVDEILKQALDAIIGFVRYERVAEHGLKVREFSETHPLFPMYFTYPQPHGTWRDAEELMDDVSRAEHVMVYNGWVMGDDPLRNFAEATTPDTVYFRRALICWGDCIKLRYGSSSDDCAYLWKRMKEYTEHSARVFDGLRLDNCHSTPIHVAEYLLECARNVRPDLYVVAELFTGGEHIDNIFVNRLGITSLIREAQSAPDSHEEGRLVYKYGGEPVGAFIQPLERILSHNIAHALFMDITHDNPCPVQTRSAFDLLPSSALVAMACCATGSSRGYDELVDYHINVVKERRLYRKLAGNDDKQSDHGFVNANESILNGKRVLNKLHSMLGLNQYSQVFVDQKTPDTVAVTRHNPTTHDTVVLVARTAFNKHNIPSHDEGICIEVGGDITEIIMELKMKIDESKKCEPDTIFISGLKHYRCDVRENIKPADSEIVRIDGRHVHFPHLMPGCVVAFHVSLPQHTRDKINVLRQRLCDFGFTIPDLDNKPIETKGESSLVQTCRNLSLVDYNSVLFRCDQEERADGKGGGTYHIPNWENLTYCGLMGLIPHLNEIRQKNDLGHPFCGNVRAGDWLAHYIHGRLRHHDGTKQLGDWFAAIFEPYYSLPQYMKPLYFDAIVNGAYLVIREQLFEKMGKSISAGSEFSRALAESAVSFVGECLNARLPRLADDVVNGNQIRHPDAVSLSAGLPHFAEGIWRNWGRDTFIALPGCLLVTGRLAEARNIILAYAGTLRYGLIPNLLGSGTHARYNCRDAIWFWLYAIVRYAEAAQSTDILNDAVLRLYANDDDEPYAQNKIEPLHLTMYEALERHFVGISYRERNAGHQIDEHMQSQGFNNAVTIDKTTGFVYGGNSFNCGTWMDKMGSSDKAGNRGQPATPRDGAAVELQGLCAYVLKFLNQHSTTGAFPHNGVKNESGLHWTWVEWREHLQQHFERCFFVPGELPKTDVDPPANPNPALINRQLIVKDCFQSSRAYTDYQLRPNFCIALAVAPDLLSTKNAWAALDKAKQILVGPLGMKTLDPSDWAYHGDYNNDDDSNNKATAKGWNYHQGPEWVWVLGYYLKARLAIAKHSGDSKLIESSISECQQVLAAHNVHIHKSIWRSLPELTNSKGKHCAHSCEAQAWSIGCILEVLDDMNKIC